MARKQVANGEGRNADGRRHHFQVGRAAEQACVASLWPKMPKSREIFMLVCNQDAKSREILMFVCLQKDAKQCCDATK